MQSKGQIATIRAINTGISSNPVAALPFSAVLVQVLIGNILFPDLDGTLLKGVCFFNQSSQLFDAVKTF